MNREDLQQINENMAETYRKAKMEDKIEKLKNKKVDEPIFEPLVLHPEQTTNHVEINLKPIEIFHDLMKVDNSIKHSVIKYNNLLVRSKMRLLDIEKTLVEAEEHKKDMLLYNTENITRLTDEDFYENFDYEDDVFSCKSLETKEANLSVVNVTGNGFDGNNYIFDPRQERFAASMKLTEDWQNMFTNNYSTPYEYSRINISNDEPNKFSLANFGDTHAKCILELRSEENLSRIMVSVFGEPIYVNKIEYSNDGLNYKEIYQDREILRVSKIYSVPNCKFIKLHLEATTYTKEIVAFKDHNLPPKGPVNHKDLEKENVKIVRSGKRSRIGIAQIKGAAKSYIPKSIFKSRELIDEGEEISSIAIATKEYIPSTIKKDIIKYFIIINGKATEIKPINSFEEGIKIVKTSKRTYPEERAIFIDEDIKSAQLIVELDSINKEVSPIIENISVLKY